MSLMNLLHNRKVLWFTLGFCVLVILILLFWYDVSEIVGTSEGPGEIVSEFGDKHHSPTSQSAGDEARPEEGAAIVEANASVPISKALAIYDSLTYEEKNSISDCLTELEPALEAEVCGKVRAICNLLRQATGSSNSSWKLDGQPMAENLELLSRYRGLALCGIWSMAYCNGGASSGTTEDFISGWRFAQSVSSEDVMGQQINRDVMECAAYRARKLLAISDADLSKLIESTGDSESWSRMLNQEADADDQIADKLAAMSREDAIQELKQILTRYGIDSVQPVDPEQAVSSIHRGAALAREWAGSFRMSNTQRRESLRRLKDGNSDPIVDLYLNGIEATLEMTERARISAAMFAAGLRILRDGSNVAPLQLNPSTGRSFTYIENLDKRSFELEADVEFGDPIRLRFE